MKNKEGNCEFLKKKKVEKIGSQEKDYCNSKNNYKKYSLNSDSLRERQIEIANQSNLKVNLIFWYS